MRPCCIQEVICDKILKRGILFDIKIPPSFSTEVFFSITTKGDHHEEGQVAILAAAICLTAAGCGNTLQKSANPSASIYNYKEQSITMQSQPKRIVTLSAPLLNMAYAIGGTSLARPTTSSPIPDSAKALPELGQVSHINMEKLVELNPDLVLGEKGQNGKLESLLQSNKIPYLLINYDGINDNIPLMKFWDKCMEDRNKPIR